MPKGNSKFTKRARAAVDELQRRSDLSFLTLGSGSLFSPVLRSDNYEWIKVMDSDGLLVAPRRVSGPAEGATPKEEVELLVGVVIQSEDATSQTKPNPIGKAAIAHAPNGIWFDTKNEGRKRLDRCYVLMLLPKGAAPKQQAKFNTAKRNVTNAADMMPDCEILEVPRGISAEDLVGEIEKRIRKWFKGRGRPKVKQ